MCADWLSQNRQTTPSLRALEGTSARSAAGAVAGAATNTPSLPSKLASHAHIAEPPLATIFLKKRPVLQSNSSSDSDASSGSEDSIFGIVQSLPGK